MRLLPLIAPVFVLTLGSLAQAADATKIASLEVSIDDAKLVEKDAGIRTLFVILYDAESKEPKPRPYGAMKVDLSADAKGTFYKGDLTSSNVMAMGGGSLPKVLKVKVRLDKDGSAGPDQGGDLVGIAEKVKAGDKVKIVINTAI